MKKRKTAEFICFTCKKICEKPESELKRNLEKNRRNFCSRSCCGKANTEHLRKFDNTKYLRKGSFKDEFSGIRDFVRRSKNRKCESTISKEELLEIWNNQKGICPYTKIKLVLPDYKVQNSKIYTASLDRIDSNLGYNKGNVQFVSMAINYMKGTMSHKETIELIEIIKLS